MPDLAWFDALADTEDDGVFEWERAKFEHQLQQERR